MKYDTLVLIGRFQPVHIAHVELIHRAMSMCRQLVIIVGSTDLPPTFKNPWTYMDRRIMLTNAVNAARKSYVCEVSIEANTDSMYNDAAWATRVQAIVSKYSVNNETTAIIGHKKDESSFYLDMFPQWGFEEVELLQPLNATKVRDYYFSKGQVNMNFLTGVVPVYTLGFLDRWKKTSTYTQIVEENEFISTYKRQYAALPYAPIFVTVDAIVTCANHVLMVKRKAFPGKGLWALPGGFLNANDPSILSAAIRELKEETSIKVPVPVLMGSITKSKVFDAIGRSTRGRTITHAFLIELSDTNLPKVKGEDDAEVAKFIPYAEIRRDTCYEDHFDMSQSMVGF